MHTNHTFTNYRFALLQELEAAGVDKAGARGKIANYLQGGSGARGAEN